MAQSIVEVQSSIEFPPRSANFVDSGGPAEYFGRMKRLSLLLVFTAACASSKPAEAPPPASEAPAVPAAEEIAPPPFTAEQIRDATKPGRTYVFLMETPNQLPVKRQISFLTVTNEGCTTENVLLDMENRPLGAPEKADATWDELVGHARYPKNSTVISEGEIDVPAGKFEAVIYTVTDKDGQVSTVHFAKSLPGAPVKFQLSKDGVVLMTMTLLEHRA